MFVHTASLSSSLICFFIPLLSNAACVWLDLCVFASVLFRNQVLSGVAFIWSISMMFLVVCVGSGTRLHSASVGTIPIGWDLTCDTLLVSCAFSSFNVKSYSGAVWLV